MENVAVSSFPKPPGYYVDFKEDEKAREPPNIERIKKHSSKYTIFGRRLAWEAQALTLEQSGVTQLYPKNVSNIKMTLRRLNFSLVNSVMELFKYMRYDPESSFDKVEDIELIVNNIYHLLNSLREQQAKEQLIELSNQAIYGLSDRSKSLNGNLREMKKSFAELQQKQDRLTTTYGFFFKKYEESDPAAADSKSKDNQTYGKQEHPGDTTSIYTDKKSLFDNLVDTTGLVNQEIRAPYDDWEIVGPGGNGREGNGGQNLDEDGSNGGMVIDLDFLNPTGENNHSSVDNDDFV